MNAVTKTTAAVQNNFDPKIAFSAAVGFVGAGLAMFAMHKSNIKALKQAANAAAGKAGK
jgi:hypothetical protein